EMSCSPGRIEFQRRNPDTLPFLQPVLAVGALAVHAQFAFADDALDVGERQSGKARLKKAVDPHVVLIRRYDDGLNLCRQRWRLGDGLWRLRNQGSRLPGGRRREARRLARTMRRRPLRLRTPIRSRALRTIARRTGFCQWPFDATAHGDPSSEFFVKSAGGPHGAETNG